MNTQILPKNFTSTAAVLWLVLLICGSATPPALAAATSVYVAQNAQGANDGSSCANARPVSFFNTGGNWGAGATQIGPGTTVFLCGTITTNLTFQGSGTSGDYITVDGTGATMNASFNAKANTRYGKIKNAKWADNFGSGLFTCTSCDNFIFDGNHADNWHGANAVYLVEDGATQLPHHITLSNNYIRSSSSNFGDVQNDIFKCASCTDAIIEGNYLEHRIAGASPYTEAHNDVIQSFQKGGASLGPPARLTIRYNMIVVNSPDANARSWTMLENLTGANHIYGNVFLGLRGAEEAVGMDINTSGSGAVFHIYNNTFVAKNSASNNTLYLAGPGTANVRNNVFHIGKQQTALYGNMIVNRDHNLWFGSSIPSCSGHAGEICGQDPQFTNYSNNDFSLLSNSPAINAGTNLGSLYDKYVLPNSSWPSPALGQRATSGNWAISAYEAMGSSTALPAPKNLRVAQ
jgi:hypothetical protein